MSTLSRSDAREHVRNVLRQCEGFHEGLAWLESHTPDEDGIRKAVEGAALRGFRIGLQARGSITGESLQNLEAAMVEAIGGIV